MKRRAFITLWPTLLPASLKANQTPVREVVDSWKLATTPTSFVQSLVETNDNLYYVVYNRSTRTASLGFASLKDRTSSIQPLPTDVRFYSGLGIRSSGGVVLPCVTTSHYFEVRQLSQTGAQLRTSPIPQPAAIDGYAVVGNSLVIFRSDGSISLMNLETDRVTVYPGVLPKHGGFTPFATSDHQLLIVDQSNARVSMFDIQSGKTASVTLTSPEITNAQMIASAKIRARPVTAPPESGSMLIVQPSNPDSNNSIYCLVYPLVRKEGGLILRFFSGGTVQDRFRIVFPDQNTEPGLPSHLVSVNGRLCLIFGDGSVYAYNG